MNEPSIKRSIDLRYREKTLPAFRQLPNHRQWSEGVNSPPLQVPLPFREGGQGLVACNGDIGIDIRDMVRLSKPSELVTVTILRPAGDATSFTVTGH